MMEYHEANDADNKAILLELGERCKDDEVAAVLSCYVIDASGAHIRKELNKQKPPQLKKAAAFLQVFTEVDTTKKADIIVNIMRKLNTLLKDLCGICGAYYSNDLEHKPLYSCIICSQGCHDQCFNPISTLYRQLDGNQQKAMQFVCTTCYSDNRPDDAAIVVHAKKSPLKAKVPDDDTDDAEKLTQELKEAIGSSSESESESSSTDTSKKKKKKKLTKKREAVKSDDHHRRHSEDPEENCAKPICPQYKYGRCLDYETCKEHYDHPRRCRNWMMFGKCRFNTSCKYHHPKLCFSSLAERKCMNLECKYFHLRYTQRYERISEQVTSEYQQAPQPPSHPARPPPVRQHHQQTNRQPPPTRMHNQHPTTLPENHFLYQHIQETNTTMKNLQTLISNLLSGQNNVTMAQHQAPVQHQNQYPAGSQNEPQILQPMIVGTVSS